MISYADFERIYRLERDSPLLQSMTQTFYSEVLELAETPELKDQRDHMRSLLDEIYERRKVKIVLYALRSMKGKPPDNIVQLEELFYNSLTKLFAENRDEVFQPAASKPTKQTLVVNKIKVRIMRPLPSIVASDLNEYGPFNGGEVVELPEENARVLITQGIAEEAAR